MSTVQLYCHECSEVVTAGADEFKCSRCNGGFVELLSESGRTSSAAASHSIGADDENDDDGPLLDSIPFMFRSYLSPTPEPPHSHLFASLRTSATPQAEERSSGSSSEEASGSNAMTETRSRVANAARFSSRMAPPFTSLPSHFSTRNVSANRHSVTLVGQPSTSANMSPSATAAQTSEQATSARTDVHSRSARRSYLPQHPLHSRQNLNDQMVQPTNFGDLFNMLGALSQPQIQAVGADGQAQAAHGGQPFFPFFPMMFPPMHGDPRDYVFSDQGIDNVITQLLGQLGSSGGPPPARPEVIEQIPDAFITSEQTQSGLQCFVCFEEFNKDEKVKRLPCGHHYHCDCILPWLQQHGTCPVCRKTLDGVDTSTYCPEFPMPSNATTGSAANGSVRAGQTRTNANDGDSESFYDANDDSDSANDASRPFN